MMTEEHHYNAFLKTVLISLAGWFLYVISDTMMKWLTQDYPVSEVLVLTYGLGLVIIVPYIAYRHGFRAFAPAQWKWHLARGLSGSVGGFLGVEALHRIPMADFYGVVFLTPLLLCLLSHFILKERIGRHRITAIVVGFMGVMILAGPKFASGSSGYLFALSAVLFAALNGIFVRKIGREPILLLFAFYVYLVNVLLNLPILWLGREFVMPGWSDVPLFAAVPVVVLGGLLAYSVSFSRVRETAMIAPFHYSQILWGTILGYVLFHDVPTLRTLAGAAVIIGAGLYMIWREHTLHKATVLRALPR
jgi:S-adenosylmethionine uptake transporter